MQTQLKLFNIVEPKWEDITTEWLLNYLQTEYPEMKFKLFEDEYIEQTVGKKATCKFYITNGDIDLSIWDNPLLIHLGVEQKYGSWSGMFRAVNNMKDFKNRLPMYIERCKKHQNDYKNFKNEFNTTE